MIKSTISTISTKHWSMPVNGLYCLDNDNRFAGNEQSRTIGAGLIKVGF